MNKLNFIRMALVFVGLGIAGCTFSDGVENATMRHEDLIFDANPEPAKGKQDVYDSMARAAKYNVDVVGNSLHKKVLRIILSKMQMSLLMRP